MIVVVLDAGGEYHMGHLGGGSSLAQPPSSAVGKRWGSGERAVVRRGSCNESPGAIIEVEADLVGTYKICFEPGARRGFSNLEAFLRR